MNSISWGKNASVKIQFYLISSILLSCAALAGFFAYHHAERLLLDRHIGYAQQNGMAYAYEMEHRISRIYNIVGLLQTETALQALVGDAYTPASVDNLKQVSKSITNYSITNGDIADISIHSPQIHWSTFYPGAQLDDMAASLGSSQGLVCLGLVQPQVYEYQGYAPYLVFGFNLYGPDKDKPQGSLFISTTLRIPQGRDPILPDSGAFPSEPEARLAPNALAYYVADAQLKLYPFSNADPEKDRAVYEELLAQKEGLSAKKEGLLTLDGQAYSYICSRSPSTGFYVICAIDKSLLKQDLAPTRLLVMLIVLLFLLLFFLLFGIFLRNVVEPLKRFNEHIQTIKEGDRRKMRSPLQLDGCREIRDLSCEFDEMMVQITRLEERLVTTMSNLYEADIEKKNAEINWLRSQINPHFLYNTLETIKGLALGRGSEDIASIAQAMGSIYRYSIKGEDRVRLSEEWAVAKAYLDIQKTRFPGRFEVIFHLPADAQDALVMKMLLQPLVENAVVHGLEGKCGQGILFIGAKIHGDALVLSVMDDGCGIEEARLEKLLSHLEQPRPSKEFVGLVNTAQRIRLSYGPEYGIHVDSRMSEGTKVEIRLPLEYAPPKPQEVCHV